MAAGTEDENGRRQHVPQYTEGVTRDQQLAVKRLVDVVGAAAGLVLGAPAMLATAAAVRATMGAPVLFRQQRPGLHGQPFGLYKFRTMTDARGPDGALLPDEQRLTRVGQFIRSTSLDELPQLLNVLKGEMSLVGPRPLLMRYLPRYSPRQAKRHEVKPGITGLAQVRGRNALTWPKKFELDVEYVENWSLRLDAQILLETVLRTVKREGISSGGHVTMPEFMGNE
jgi:lipopolysaccharide/colanic/teichoic acid biosynthesis glycosyltransferase